MRRKLKIKGQVYAAVCLFLLLLGGPRMWADLAGAGSAPLELTRIEGKIVLDGMSTEAAWDGVSYHSLTGLLPNAGQTPRHPTDILVAYDDEFLYVAGRLYDDEPEKIQANSRKRDSEDGSSEWFGVVIDSFNDKENGLAFFTTPAGLRWDAAVRNDCRSLCLNTDWNAPWDVAVARNSQGWFAEMRIPLSCLKFQEIDGKVTMGLISWRRHARTNAYTIFPDIPPKWFTRSRWKVSRAREIVLTGIKSKRPLYIAPYLLGGLNQTPVLNSEGTAYETQNDSTFEAGLDIKYGLSNNLTLDVTVNTDFAQVEADDQQLNLTRYSLFFPEKRLFFQERSANFDFCFDDTNRLFYSRRLGIRDGQQVRILGGVRMVGRVGAWDIGVLDMQTAKFDGSAGENFGVFRFRRQVLNPYSYMGGIVTSRVGTDGKVNAAYGLDGIFRVFNNDYFSFKWAQTFESDKDNPLFSTDSARYRFYWHRPGSTGWRYAFGHSRAGAEYEPGMGFEQRRNFSAVDGVFGYGWMVSDKSSALNYHRVKGTGEIIWSNETDALESAKGAVSWYFLTRGNYELEIRPGYRVEHVREAFTMSGGLTIMPGKYRFANVYANFRLPGGSLFHTTLEVDAGSFYGGKRYAVSLSPSWAMSPALELSAFYRFTHIRLPGEAQKLNAHITRFRMLWMPSVKVSGTAFVQYNSAARLMLANVRLRYNPREGVDLYLVYNENFNTDRRLETPSLPISAHRTVMMKCTYTFQL